MPDPHDILAGYLGCLETYFSVKYRLQNTPRWRLLRRHDLKVAIKMWEGAAEHCWRDYEDAVNAR